MPLVNLFQKSIPIKIHQSTPHVPSVYSEVIQGKAKSTLFPKNLGVRGTVSWLHNENAFLIFLCTISGVQYCNAS